MKTNAVIISSSSQRVCREVQGYVRNAQSGNTIYLAASNDEFKTMALRHRPWLALVESNWWHEATAHMIARYASRFPRMSIAVFGYERLTPGRAAGFVNLGAASYVDLRIDDEDELTEAFRLIMRDQRYLPHWLEAAAEEYELGIPDYCRLNKSEILVLRLSAMGNSIEDIALKLEIGTGTARNYISSIHRKFGVHSHAEMTGLALRMGIVKPGELVAEEINITALEI
jgi:DNA-binding NarL/FixJ family response regulator